MSVQAGIWNFDGSPVDVEILARISSCTAEYGPDHEEAYVANSIGMLYRASHTTPQSYSEHQPYKLSDGRVLTWDGRLDNGDELIREFETGLENGTTDLDIVVRAYEKWGSLCFSRILGDWALSIWDAKRKKLILARDYMGIRRLYYQVSDTAAIWSSSLEALALERGRLSLNEEYLAGYLAMRPNPRITPYCEIECVPPGGWIQVEPGKISSQLYWRFDPHRRIRYKSDQEYEEHFRLLLQKSVQRRLRSSSVVLAELSGGFDSSAIVCLADQLHKAGQTSPPLDTFSYSFPDEPEGDDDLYFVKVEKKRGRLGHRVNLLGIGDSFSLEYSKFVATPGFGPRSEVVCARDSLARERGYRVILSGIGGDELMGQALDPRVQMADLLSHLRLRTLCQQLIQWSILTRRPWIQLATETALLLFPNTVRVQFTPATRPDTWLHPAFAKRHRFSHLLLQASYGPFIWRPTARDSLQTYMTLSGLLANSRPCTQEMRYPYLDRELFEFLTSIPIDQILRPGQRRSLMRRALAGILPAEILARKTKQSEVRCHIVTLAKHWNEIERRLGHAQSAACGYINEPELKAGLIAAKNGQIPRNFLFLLRALSFELWFQYVTRHNILGSPQDSTKNIRVK